MKIIDLSYVASLEYSDPKSWLKRINCCTGVLESLARDNEVLSIQFINYQGIFNKDNVAYHFLKCKKWQLLFPLQLNRYVKKLQPDVILVQGLVFPWQVLLLRWQLGKDIKIIEQHHAEKPFKDIRQYIQQWLDRYIHAYLFCSLDLGQRWVARGQIHNPNKIREIMGMSSPFYPMKKEIAKSMTKVSGDVVFLWVGGLDSNKDPLLVMKAFIEFVTIHQTVKLYMIYQTFQLLDELKALMASVPGTSDFIQLVGKVNYEDLQYWYSAADFIISSSHYEGAGVAVCEAISCGCIPILTNIPSFRMMTDNGRIGILYEAGNLETLISSLIKSLKLNREEMKQLVLDQFERKLSFDANAKSIMEVIHAA